jgi:hypothetical protein
LANNKVQLSNGTVIIDLTSDTVTSASHIKSGLVGHLADGTTATGTLIEKDVKSVTYNLSGGATASISTSEVVTGQGFSAKLTAPTGYVLSGVTVTMGGNDITSQVLTPDEAGGGGGGSVVVTEEANATGITCVITTSSEPTPPTPSGDIPLNEQLIDYTATTNSVELDEYGQAVASDPWYYVSGYTAIDPAMTFTFKGAQWGILAVYDSSKTYVRSFTMNDIADSSSSNVSTGTLSGSRISGAYFVRITSQGNTSNALSLIRTA